MRYGLIEPRIEHPARRDRHRRSHGEGNMHLIYDAVSIAQIDDHRRRKVFPGESKPLHIIEA